MRNATSEGVADDSSLLAPSTASDVASSGASETEEGVVSRAFEVDMAALGEETSIMLLR